MKPDRRPLYWIAFLISTLMICFVVTYADFEDTRRTLDCLRDTANARQAACQDMSWGSFATQAIILWPFLAAPAVMWLISELQHLRSRVHREFAPAYPRKFWIVLALATAYAALVFYSAIGATQDGPVQKYIDGVVGFGVSFAVLGCGALVASMRAEI
jgi:hypothetical protein